MAKGVDYKCEPWMKEKCNLGKQQSIKPTFGTEQIAYSFFPPRFSSWRMMESAAVVDIVQREKDESSFSVCVANANANRLELRDERFFLGWRGGGGGGPENVLAHCCLRTDCIRLNTGVVVRTPRSPLPSCQKCGVVKV